MAISADGVDWYEIQDLRNLRSDQFTDYDIDLDLAAAACGLAYNAEFRIRFCQYDNGPVAWDGIALSDIRLEGEFTGLVLHLPMDDNGDDVVVRDVASQNDQTFIDPGGDPSTGEHSGGGAVDSALGFDGLDDRITLTPWSYRSVLAEASDFAICMWWKTSSPDPAQSLHFLSNFAAAADSILWYTSPGSSSVAVQFVTGTARWVAKSWPGGADDQWHHYVLTRQGTVISIYRDAELAVSDDHPENIRALTPADRDLTIGNNPTASQPSPGWADDLRIYNRGLDADQVRQIYELGVSS